MPRLTKSERDMVERKIQEGGLTIAELGGSFVVRDQKPRGKRHGKYSKRGWAVRQALTVIEGRTAANRVAEILAAENRLR